MVRGQCSLVSGGKFPHHIAGGNKHPVARSRVQVTGARPEALSRASAVHHRLMHAKAAASFMAWQVAGGHPQLPSPQRKLTAFAQLDVSPTETGM